MFRSYFRFVFVLSGSLALCAAMSELSLARTSTTADDLIVIKPPSSVGLDDRPRSITQFDQTRIKKAVNQGLDLPSLLDTVAGARILDLGGPLQTKRLQVRGGSPSQTVVVVDGVPLRTPFATGLDLGMLSLESLNQIELLRGGAGAQWGNGAISGVLNARSRSSEDGMYSEFGVKYGSLSRTEIDALLSPGPFLVAGAYRQTDGDFPFVSELPGLQPQAKVRKNNDVRFGRLLARYDGEFKTGTLTSLFAVAAKEAGVAGFETQANALARETRANARARIMWRSKDYSLGVFGSGLSIDYEDPDPLVGTESRTRFGSLGFDGRLRLLLFGHLIRLEVVGMQNLSESTEHGNVSRQEFEFLALDEFELGAWSFTASNRVSFIDDWGFTTTPSLGLGRPLGDELLFRASLGRSFRAPALDELYHPPQRGFSGNPDLSPESAWEAELGLKWKWAERQRLDFSVYARRLDDIILYLNRNAFEIRPENVGQANVAGLELESSHEYRTGRGVRMGLVASSALSWSKLQVTQTAIPTQPRYSANLELSLGLPWPTPDAFEIFTRGRWVSSTSANLQSTLSVPSYLRLDTGITYAVFKGVFLALSASNLLDDRSLLTVNKIPLPGRLFLASIRVSDLSHN